MNSSSRSEEITCSPMAIILVLVQPRPRFSLLEPGSAHNKLFKSLRNVISLPDVSPLAFSQVAYPLCP